MADRLRWRSLDRARHGLGLEFTGSTQPSDFALADLRLEGLNLDKLDIFWHAKGILAFFPIVGIVTV